MSRGISAQELHGNIRHIYIPVDDTASNWKEYVLEKANNMHHGGMLHILRYRTFEEIERMYV